MTTITAQHADTSSTSSEQALLEALRSNLDLLGELAARYQVPTRRETPQDLPSIGSPEDVYFLLGPEMAPLAQEQLRVLLLNTRNQVVGQRVVYQGNVSSSQVRTAEVLRPAVQEGLPSIMVVHNHPSGDPDPSPDDVAITRKLMQAAKLLDIDLLDHVVIGGNDYVSLKARGLLHLTGEAMPVNEEGTYAPGQAANDSRPAGPHSYRHTRGERTYPAHSTTLIVKGEKKMLGTQSTDLQDLHTIERRRLLRHGGRLRQGRNHRRPLVPLHGGVPDSPQGHLGLPPEAAP